jgi:hypothetical protein
MPEKLSEVIVRGDPETLLIVCRSVVPVES